MEQKIRLGIIGIGNMGTGHANNIRDGLLDAEIKKAEKDHDKLKEKSLNYYKALWQV